MWLAGRKWLSDSWSVLVALALYRIMPAAPPWRTLKPSSTRPTGLPRLQITIMPVYVPGAAGLAQRISVAGTTNGAGPTPAVSDIPSSVSDAPPPFTVMVFLNARSAVLAATVVTHG